ncbi:hypothetical protein [Streptomyces sp. RTd22]|uniref:hypothetical protein n=1 Tax=Streptomyces sp. RTd22 TaxID=1841249 RepID=UPI0013318CB4|nr:hypothetical protein [Streptomyces sp. RTd22]
MPGSSLAVVHAIQVDKLDVAAAVGFAPEIVGGTGTREEQECGQRPHTGAGQQPPEVFEPLQLRQADEGEGPLASPIAVIRSGPYAGDSATTRSSSCPRRCSRQAISFGRTQLARPPRHSGAACSKHQWRASSPECGP